MPWIDLVAPDLGEFALVEHVSQKSCAVSGEPDSGSIWRAPLTGIGQIGGHPRNHVAFFAAQIGFQLDDSSPPGHIDTAAIVYQVALMLDLAELGSEPFAKQLVNEDA